MYYVRYKLKTLFTQIVGAPTANNMLYVYTIKPASCADPIYFFHTRKQCSCSTSSHIIFYYTHTHTLMGFNSNFYLLLRINLDSYYRKQSTHDDDVVRKSASIARARSQFPLPNK